MKTPKWQEVEYTKIRIRTEYDSEESYAEDSLEPQRPHSTLGQHFANVWTVLWKFRKPFAFLLSLIKVHFYYL